MPRLPLHVLPTGLPRPARRVARRGPFLRALLATVGTLALSGVVTAADPSSAPSDVAPVAEAPVAGILGAQTEAYRDAFDEAAEWVDLGADENGRTSLEDGRLFMSIKGRDVNYRDWYELAEPAAVLRVEALVDIDERGTTAAGVACGSALGLPRWFIAGVNNADEWFLGRQIDGRFQVVDGGLLMLPTSPSRGPVSVAIECASAPDEGGDYVAVSVDGRPVSVETGLGRLDIPVGPYARAGLYVATDEGTGSARFDDLVVHVGEVYAPVTVERDHDVPSE
jgi:hypothetical protein